MSAARTPQLELERLSGRAWRLCDRGVSNYDASFLVAYVEQYGDSAYAVTWVSYGVGTALFPSLDDVLREAFLLVETPPPSRGTKPIPIPHMPPSAAH